jgi:hypothetical protein
MPAQAGATVAIIDSDRKAAERAVAGIADAGRRAVRPPGVDQSVGRPLLIRSS